MFGVNYFLDSSLGISNVRFTYVQTRISISGRSLADCFAAALPRERKALIYTGDPAFKQVQDDVEIAWL